MSTTQIATWSSFTVLTCQTIAMLSNDTADCNGQLGGRAQSSLEVNNLDLRLPSDPHRVWREKVGPNPVMMIDDLVRTEMRSVAHRVAVGDRDHSKAQRSG